MTTVQNYMQSAEEEGWLACVKLASDDIEAIAGLLLSEQERQPLGDTPAEKRRRFLIHSMHDSAEELKKLMHRRNL